MSETYPRKLTNDEIINGLREALKFYANSENWNGQVFKMDDLCKDDCAGSFRKSGEKARQALDYFNRSTSIVQRTHIGEDFLG